MAALFDNLQIISSSGDSTITDNVIASISADGSSIDFVIQNYIISEFINGQYYATISRSSGTYSISSNKNGLVSGTNEIMFEIDDPAAPPLVDGAKRWKVDIVGDITSTPETTPTYTNDDISIKFYSNAEDVKERVKFYGFDEKIIANVMIKYNLTDNSIKNKEIPLDTNPTCDVLESGGVEIDTILSLTVNYSNGDTSIIPEFDNFDYYQNATIQSNIWPGSCVLTTSEGGEGTTISDSSVEESLATIVEILKNGLVVKQEPTEEWAFNRAATVNALREAQQLENVFNEMTTPTKYPDVGYKSENELNSKPDIFFRPEDDNFDPSYEERGCSFDPIPPEELKPLEEPTDEGSGESEESCHPPY